MESQESRASVEMDPRQGEWSKTLDQLFEMPRGKVLLATVGLVIGIAFFDNLFRLNISLGLLYFFPLALGAMALRRWQMVVLAAVCSLLKEHFGPYSWETLSASRLLSSVVTLGGVGLLLNETARNRRQQLRHYREMTAETEKRQEAEGQLRTLVESSPAAIVTVDEDGRIDLANHAAGELLRLPHAEVVGRSIGEFFPTLAELQSGGGDVPYRTATHCKGRRATGEHFPASVWFATYPTRNGRNLAAIITDSSEELRDWQETSLQNLLRSTRVLVGSVSHEIRNMCAAISVVHANLGRIDGVSETEDYAALGTLAQGLSRLATVELQAAGEPEEGVVSLQNLLEEFRIVLEPTIEAESIDFVFDAPAELPNVVGDHHSLLQVLLNLARNSVRAMESAETRQIVMEVAAQHDKVFIRFKDTGPGIAKPDLLFKAFQQGADAVGLGLFVSRALVRASGGELYHEPTGSGCTMCIRLNAAGVQESPGEVNITEVHR